MVRSFVGGLELVCGLLESRDQQVGSTEQELAVLASWARNTFVDKAYRVEGRSRGDDTGWRSVEA